jgi:hypothetical protein
MGYLAQLWCMAMHRSIMWPAHGHYECRTCGREYPVAWERGAMLWRQRASIAPAQMIRPS